MKETCIYYESKHLELLHARAHHFGKKIIVIIYKHEMLVPKTKKKKKKNYINSYLFITKSRFPRRTLVMTRGS